MPHSALARRMQNDKRNGDLSETGDEEVVRQFFDAADWQLSPLATQRARKLAIVGIFLVRRLRVDVVVDTLFTERVQTRQTLGVAV